MFNQESDHNILVNIERYGISMLRKLRKSAEA